jgi:hypothetical protein
MLQASRNRLPEYLLITVWGVVAIAALLPGAGYYALPLAERAFSPQHDLFAPTGLVGHSYGIAGAFLTLAGVIGYAVRKRWRVLERAGKLKHWLQAHIFCCTLGPFLILLHTSFKFGGLVAISFFSMVLVVASGVFGRYVYVRIPKTVNGRFQTLEEIRAERDRIAQSLQAHVRIPQVELATAFAGASAKQSVMKALWSNVRMEAGNRARLRYTRKRLAAQGVAPNTVASLIEGMQRQAQLERQLTFLQPFHRLFRYWHVFHLPFAIIMLLILAVHVGVAIAFGYGWPS